MLKWAIEHGLEDNPRYEIKDYVRIFKDASMALALRAAERSKDKKRIAIEDNVVKEPTDMDKVAARRMSLTNISTEILREIPLLKGFFSRSDGILEDVYAIGAPFQVNPNEVPKEKRVRWEYSGMTNTRRAPYMNPYVAHALNTYAMEGSTIKGNPHLLEDPSK